MAKKIRINVDLIYPVGSIYFSVNNVNPSTFFGGTWTRWGNGRVPVGVDTSQTEFNTVEKTGGNKTSSYISLTLHSSANLYGYQTGSSAYADRTIVASTGIPNVSSDRTTEKVLDLPLLQPYITCYMWKRTA